MGDRIVPYLFHCIRQYGVSIIYFHILNKVTNEQPVKKEHWGKLDHELIDWLQWYVDSRYYHTDVYLGLVD